MIQQEIPVYEDQPRRRGLSGCFLLTPIGCLISLCLGLVACFCLVPLVTTVGIGAIGALFLTNTATSTGNQTIPVESVETARLLINNDRAEVNIIGHEADEIILDYTLTVYSYSTGAAEEAIKTINFDVNQRDGNTFEIIFDQQTTGLHFYDVDLNLRVPVGMQEIAITTSQDVTIDDLTADLRINAGAGNVVLTNVTGALNIITAAGDVQWTGILPTQSTSNVTTTLGRIEFTFQEKANVRYTATSSSGSVTCPLGGSRSTCTERLGDGTAQLTLNSDSGDIVILTSQP